MSAGIGKSGGQAKGVGVPGGRGGSYARLFSLKHPGSHRRVGVDPVADFKKEHYRGSNAKGGGSGSGAEVFVRTGGDMVSGVSAVAVKGGESGAAVVKPAKHNGEVRMENIFFIISTVVLKGRTLNKLKGDTADVMRSCSR